MLSTGRIRQGRVSRVRTGQHEQFQGTLRYWSYFCLSGTWPRGDSAKVVIVVGDWGLEGGESGFLAGLHMNGILTGQLVACF